MKLFTKKKKPEPEPVQKTYYSPDNWHKGRREHYSECRVWVPLRGWTGDYEYKDDRIRL
jgi:hypothetical protein